MRTDHIFQIKMYNKDENQLLTSGAKEASRDRTFLPGSRSIIRLWPKPFSPGLDLGFCERLENSQTTQHPSNLSSRAICIQTQKNKIEGKG